MRTVVLFIPHLGVGGAELQLGLLAPRLSAFGWKPVVATMEDLHGTASRLSAAGVEVVFLPRQGRSGVDAVAGLHRLVRTRRATVVHAWLWASNWRAAIARLFARDIPVIASIRSMEDDLGEPHMIGYRTLSPLFAAIAVNSVAVLERHAARTGISRDKYRLVRNGVEIERLAREGASPAALRSDPETSPVVGYVGTLHPRKRAASLAPLAARIVSRVPNARFLVVGDGPERARLEAACARHGVVDRFELVGYAASVAPYLRRMSVLVHPSMNEGSSNSILEAMALGVPVAAYAVSGNKETVTHRVTGLLADDGNEEQLASAVADLLEDPAMARRQGEAGRERIAHEYSVDGTVRATVTLYDEAASSH
jgi:glycosyltransferase involved in cell wall biosynthesis